MGRKWEPRAKIWGPMNLLSSISFWMLAVFVVVISSSDVVAFGSQTRSQRSVLWILQPESSDIADVAVELNSSNFDVVLKSHSVKFAVVEFFASWCPACRNYKPNFEKVARLFNGPRAVHPGLIVMARVDCAPKSNKDLCDRFSVSHFPQLLWGPPMKFVSGSWDSKNQNDIKFIDDIRPADHLLNWINKQLGSSFNLDDKQYDPSQQTLSSNTSNAVEITQAIHDVEEATVFAFDMIIEHKMINRETQAPLIKFLQILVAHHPSMRCRRGSAKLLMNFNELWPPAFFSANSLEASAVHGSDALKSVDICGKKFHHENWRFCRGSKNETRGFSCGLWILFHSLSVRVGNGESQLTFTVICDFVHNFFLCDECRQHFYEMCSKISVPVNTTKDLSLWLWSTHNKVNERLKIEEKILGTGDPLFPKTTWPSKELCPSCYASPSKENDGTNNIDWNTNEVFTFLARYYGVMLVSSYKEKTVNKDIELTLGDTSTNAITVPVGASLGIALASSAFGVLACLWRMHQKTRKPKKRAGA